MTASVKGVKKAERDARERVRLIVRRKLRELEKDGVIKLVEEQSKFGLHWRVYRYGDRALEKPKDS